METRVVKFNLKTFIEDYKFFYESRDSENKKKLLNNFEEYYATCSYSIRTSIKAYLFNNEISRQYTDLQDIATRCECNF